MKKYEITILPNKDFYIPNKYFLKLLRKKWRECGGTTCNKNINHFFGDDHILMQFALCNNTNYLNIKIIEII